MVSCDAASSRIEVRVGSRISGRVWKLRANIGDRVEQGAIIAELETAELDALIAQRRAEQIVLRAADVRRVPETAGRVRELLAVRHSIAPGQPHDFFVREPEDVEDAALEASSTGTVSQLDILVDKLDTTDL